MKNPLEMFFGGANNQESENDNDVEESSIQEKRRMVKRTWMKVSWKTKPLRLRWRNNSRRCLICYRVQEWNKWE